MSKRASWCITILLQSTYWTIKVIIQCNYENLMNFSNKTHKSFCPHINVFSSLNPLWWNFAAAYLISAVAAYKVNNWWQNFHIFIVKKTCTHSWDGNVMMFNVFDWLIIKSELFITASFLFHTANNLFLSKNFYV